MMNWSMARFWAVIVPFMGDQWRSLKNRDREVEGSVGLIRKLNKLRGQREKGKTEMSQRKSSSAKISSLVLFYLLWLARARIKSIRRFLKGLVVWKEAHGREVVGSNLGKR